MYFPIIDVLKENFIAKIPSIVTQWLTDNVDPVGSAVVVDESLSISGAAADAKITGDKIEDNKPRITIPFTNVTIVDNYRFATNGASVQANGYYQLYFNVNEGDIITFFRSNIGSNNTEAILLCDGSTVKSLINNSGITGNSGKYTLTVPAGVDNIKTTGILANKYPYNVFKNIIAEDSVLTGSNYENGNQKTYIVGEGFIPTIQCACDFADANDIIFIKSGVYNEAVSIWNKKLHLVGESKNTTFIVEHVGNYANPPLEMNIGSLSNITLIEDGADSESDTAQTGKLSAYCLHIEAINSTEEVFEVDNCVFKNAVHAPLGCGLQNNYTVRFRNCVFECTAVNEGAAKERGAYYCHIAVTENAQNQHIIAENCIIYSADNFAVLLGKPTGSTGSADYRFSGCTIWSAKRGQADNVVYFDNQSDATFSKVQSYGNNVAVLNS